LLGDRGSAACSAFGRALALAAPVPALLLAYLDAGVLGELQGLVYLFAYVGHVLLDGHGRVLHEGLGEQSLLLEEGVHLAFGDLLLDVGRLAALLGLLERNFTLARDHVGG